ncbi:RHS repeat-associated core domain-containing protein [Candidatus Laterigemmans baculatus]|uniref:RHS repeat-associated core domain-containing protein n=1 Tax=Candidatus Laterigemmans baculatus TaxID=2770505 RepID=UPI0013DCC0B7|nr:RHS repeat-associated core domain-containing protein [Candidatus Laterigemmans baculatus]
MEFRRFLNSAFSSKASRNSTRGRARKNRRLSRIEMLEKRELLAVAAEISYQGTPVRDFGNFLFLEADDLQQDQLGYYVEVAFKNTSTAGEDFAELDFFGGNFWDPLYIDGISHSTAGGDTAFGLSDGNSVPVKLYVTPGAGLWIGEFHMGGNTQAGGTGASAGDFFYAEIAYPGAEIELFDGATEVPDNTGSVEFSPTTVGSPVQKTFRVDNTDTHTDLVLGNISLPAGFSMVSEPELYTVPPGESVSFTVQLDATSLGEYSGEISFATNDGDQYWYYGDPYHDPNDVEDIYNFSVSGQVQYEADFNDTTLSYQVGMTEQIPFASCGCDYTIHLEQTGKIVLSYEVEIDPSTVGSDSLTLSGTFGNETFTATKSFTRTSADTEPTIVRFAFDFDRSDFTENHAAYSATLTSQAYGSPALYRMQGGPKSASGHVYFGDDKVSVSPIPRLEVSGDGAMYSSGSDVFYYPADGAGGYDDAPGAFSQLSPSAGGYELVDRNNSTYVFDSDGYVLTVTDSKGRTTTYSYVTVNNEKLISEIEGPFLTTTFTYSGDKLVQASNLIGDWVSLGYSAGLLSTATQKDPDGAGPLPAHVTSYAYDAYGRLKTKTATGGLVTTYTYDSTGRLASVDAPDGSTVSYTSPQQAAISGGAAIETVTDEQGISRQYGYDSFGNVVREIDAIGNITSHYRDSNGSLLKTILPDPDGEGPLEAPVYEYTYDTRGNRLTETLPDDSVREWEYHTTWNKPIRYTDANGQATLYGYDPVSELVLSETRVVGQPDDEFNLETDDLTIVYSYTAAPTLATEPPQGMLSSVTDAGGAVTEYEYDAQGRRTKTIYAVGTADEAFTASAYDAHGNVLSRTDELGNVTTYTYDDLNRQTSITTPDPDDAGPLTATVTTFTYNDQGQQESETVGGRTTSFAYDANGRLESVTDPDPDGTGPLLAPVTSYTYDTSGNLLTVTDPLGNVTTNSYTDGLLTSVTRPDPDGSGPLTAPVTSYTYDDMGRVLTETDPLGRVTSYAYDGQGREVSVTLPDPDGTGPLQALSSSTAYDEFGRIASQTAFDGTTVTFTYDSEGNKVAETTALGVTTFQYDEQNRVVREETPDPDGAGPLVSLVTTYTYAASGNLLTVTTPKGTTSYTYDDRGRRTSVTLPDPDGSGPQTAPVESTTYDDAGNVLTETNPLGGVTSYVYDALGQLTQVVSPDPDGNGPLSAPVTSYAYDAVGNLLATTDPNGGVTSYEHDALGRKIKETLPDPDGSGPLSAPEISYSYDAAGRLTQVTDELGNVTLYEFDNLGRRLSIVEPDPDGAGPDLSPVTTHTYDAAGQLLSTTGPLGGTTDYTYDAMGRLLSETLPDPDGTGPLASPVTSYAYDGSGRLASVVDAETQTVSYEYDATGQIESVTDPTGVTQYSYDALGRTTLVVSPDPDGSGPLASPTVTYDYDAAGDLVAVSTDDGVTSYEYDNLGRVVKITQPDPDADYGATQGISGQNGPLVSSWIVYTYDAQGQVIAETNRLGHTTGYTYDNLGRLVKKTDAEQGETSFTYDAVGNRLTLTDPVLNTTTWTYDSLNRVISETNELNDTRSFKYDSASNLIEKTDRNGRVTVYEYDNLHRRTAEKWMDGVAVIRTLSYTYDAASQLTSATDPAATYTFTYDALGRNTSTVHDLITLGFDVVIDEAYDALNRRISLAAEINGTADLANTYHYDYMNRMTRVTQGSQSGGNAVAEKRVDYTYSTDEVMQYSAVTRYADLAGTQLVATSTYGYDAADRLTSLTHTGPSSATLAGYSWGYDEADRLTEFLVAGYSDENVTYTYDDTDQLATADRDGTSNDESYTYDANGNRTGSYTAGSNNQLLSDGTYNYTYDDEGNRLTKTNIANGDSVEYRWDYRNRLTGITSRDSLGAITHEVEYTYDAFNRRIAKEIDEDGTGPGVAKEAVYIYDGLREERGNAGDHILLALNEADALTDRYLYGAAVDEVLASEEVASTLAAGDVLWPLADNLRTVRDIAEHENSTGSTLIASHIAYDAFGSIASESNLSVDFPFAFTGRERDTESSLQYNRDRYYDPVVGRWASQDPIGFEAGDANLYRYGSNGPSMSTDPSGRIEVQIVGDRFTSPNPDRQRNGIYGSVWMRPEPDEMAKIALAGGGYFIVEDYVRIACRACGQDTDLSGSSRSRRLYEIQVIPGLDEVPVYPSNDRGNQGWQYHQMFNAAYASGAEYEGKVSVTTVILLYASPPSEKVRKQFLPPYEGGIKGDYPGHQPDEIGTVTDRPVRGDTELIGRRTVRYEITFGCNGGLTPGIFSTTDDLTGETVSPIPSGPNRPPQDLR